MAEAFEVAVAIGAPLLAGELVRETGASWSEQLAKLNAATALAKSFNVTLALRNAPGSFAGSTHDCKRVVKEADSAWLRFGPRPTAFGAADDPAQLTPNSVLLWADATDADERSIARTLQSFPAVSRSFGNRCIRRKYRDRDRAPHGARMARRARITQPHVASAAFRDSNPRLAGGCGPGAVPAGIKSPSFHVVSGADAPYVSLSARH